MGRHVSLWTNIVTPFCLWFIGCLGGLGILIAFGYVTLPIVNMLTHNNKHIENIVYITQSLLIGVYVFRFSFALAMRMGLRIGIVGSPFAKLSDYEQKIVRQQISDFTDKYTYDIISWTPFFWREKTVEELAKDRLAKERHEASERAQEIREREVEAKKEAEVNAMMKELKEKGSFFK